MGLLQWETGRLSGVRASKLPASVSAATAEVGVESTENLFINCGNNYCSCSVMTLSGSMLSSVTFPILNTVYIVFIFS